MEYQKDALKKLWKNISIPSNNDFEIITPINKERLINQLIETFHPGVFFYIIFDVNNSSVIYISPDIENVLGYKANEFDLNKIIDSIHPEDLPYFYHFETCATNFYKNLPSELFFKYKFQQDFRMRTVNNTFIRILQHGSPINYLLENGLHTLIVFTDITHIKPEGIPQISLIGMQGAPSYYNIGIQKQLYKSNDPFTKRELQVMLHLANGNTSQEIANALYISVHTVNTHRKNILKKSKCKSIHHLISAAIKNSWL